MITNVPRVKLMTLTNVCADCCSPDPQWASLNRGVFVCDDCCSVHRTLGRHISYIKPLPNGVWPGKSLALVNALYASSANSIWEHVLLDPNCSVGVRKPSPNDSQRFKSEFIRSKYMHNAFVHRPVKDKAPSDAELAQQLHASVRTDNLDTSLRLLAQGADPNTLHPEKGSAPLHVAAASGQELQIELLLVYGADPRVLDLNDNSPIDVANNSGQTTIAQRLIESCFEITDRLCSYLCGPKIDHAAGIHLVVPEVNHPHDNATTIVARRRLRALSDVLFEQLAQDIYDEIDRRELEELCSSDAPGQSVPFLPVNADFSTTRNQGRQKLARFTEAEMAGLIADLIAEAQRRFKNAGSDSDDEPLYDCVASDDDYKDLEESSTFKDSSLTEITPQATPENRGSLTSQTLLTRFASSSEDLPTRPHSMYEARSTPTGASPPNAGTGCNVAATMSTIPNAYTGYRSGSRSNLRSASLSPRRSPTTPTREWAPFYSAVLTQTEDITRLIHDLLVAAQDNRVEAFPTCVSAICGCVMRMRDIIPDTYQDALVKDALEDLLSKGEALKREHENAPQETHPNATPGVIQSAYDVAKSAKTLVTSFPNALPNQDSNPGKNFDVVEV